MPFPSATTYYDIVNKYCYKAIWGTWLVYQNMALDDLLVSIFSTFISYIVISLHKALAKSGRKVIVIGDGRYDSPGFTA